MKNLAKLMAYAAIVIIAVFVAMSICSCDNKMDLEEICVPAPQDTTQTQTQTPSPTPQPKDSVDNSWQWSVIGAKTLDFDEMTEIVDAHNIGLLTRQVNGKAETKLDSITLSYKLMINIEAPTYIRITKEKSDATVLRTAQSDPSPSYGEYAVTEKDSTCSVTTGHTFTASHYKIAATTISKRGFSRHPKHDEAFKYVTEKAQWASIWNEYIGEVENNDSIFARYNNHNNLIFKIISDKGQTWYVKREVTVIVDHFIKVKEKEEEEKPTPAPTKVEADEWVTGLGRLVSLTKCLREDTRFWCDAALLEGADGYTIILDTYDTDGKYIGREKKFVSFEVCPRSNDYDGVAYVNGGFYPAAITYDAKSRGWVLVSVVNGAVKDQSIDARDADARGIKNFKENNTAYPWPYMTNTSTSKTVDGQKVINVSGKTSVRAYRGCVVADSLLKK